MICKEFFIVNDRTRVTRIHKITLKKVSKKFGDIKDTPVVLVTQTHRKATSIKYLSNFPREDEVLSSFGCHYKFVKEEKLGDYL